MPWIRPDGRRPDQLRAIAFQRRFTQFPAGSVLAQFGQTQVLCTVTIQSGVPRWLMGKGQGWLTAEYRMLPGATPDRQSREWLKLSGRTQEIQRLIGRSLRAAIDLEKLGERTLLIDADVLQADAGTRTTAINGSWVALQDAIAQLIDQGELMESPIQQSVAAVSVALIEGEAFLDPNYLEDVKADVDCNVVMGDRGELIEIQGTAEANHFTRAQLNRILDLAEQGIIEIQAAQQAALRAPS
ncbi:ribonuclease PH [Synechococcus elongatus]|uniref:Ribonuclease PH n=1 Tax=Synechococcus elongatus PCC 11802 TaxID=2283154 RepID=A0AAT9JXV8_SYNEL|nr:ribonuclease PH [Synechococcus elongatus]QFZ92272.1 ribonuclease PH [Synechococcus elongatus PCC 11802]